MQVTSPSSVDTLLERTAKEAKEPAGTRNTRQNCFAAQLRDTRHPPPVFLTCHVLCHFIMALLLLQGGRQIPRHLSDSSLRRPLQGKSLSSLASLTHIRLVLLWFPLLVCLVATAA